MVTLHNPLHTLKTTFVPEKRLIVRNATPKLALKQDTVSFCATKSEKVTPSPKKEFLYDVTALKPKNIALQRKETSPSLIDYTLEMNYPALEEIDYIPKADKSKFVLSIDNENGYIKTIFPETGLLQSYCLQAAIQESLNKGFEGEIVVSTKRVRDIKKLDTMGFVPITPINSYKEILQSTEKTATLFKSANPDINLKENPLEFKLDKLNALPLLEKINRQQETYFTTQLDKSVKRAERLPFYPLVSEKPSTIGPEGNINAQSIYSSHKDSLLAEITPHEDGTATFRSCASSFFDAKVNNRNVFKESAPLTVSPLDEIQVGNNLYLWTGKGLRQISDNAAFINRLFHQSLEDTVFSQGDIGDCYFLAALNSVLSSPQGKELICHIFEELPNGDIAVTFPAFPDDTFVFDKLNLISTSGEVNTVSTGVVLLEKAYSQLREKYNWHNSSEQIINDDPKKWLDGGFGIDAMYVLTGGTRTDVKASEYLPKDKANYSTPSIDEVAQKHPKITQDIEKTLNILANTNDWMATAGTMFFNSYTEPRTNLNQNTRYKLSPRHAYSVVKVDSDNKQIYLFNPHNKDQQKEKERFYTSPPTYNNRHDNDSIFNHKYHDTMKDLFPTTSDAGYIKEFQSLFKLDPPDPLLEKRDGMLKLSYEDFFKYFGTLSYVKLPFSVE